MPMQANSPVYAVIGDPVAHSLSPAMHNRALAACGLPGVYVGFRVTDLPVAVAGIRALGIRGVSVTIPHKVAVMPLLDEIDDTARRIGAVNTISNESGVLKGTNTDGLGALKALETVTAVDGRRVAILGAGGAARAVAWALSNAGAKVALFNRTVPRAAALARQMNLEWGRMDNLARWRAEILVNTTPVGMAPDAGAVPVAAAILDPAMVVMDIVYNPLETTLLAAARRLGCTTVDGVQMLVFQGAAQFERWTGVAAPVTVMRQAVIEALSPTLTHRHGQAAVF
ncbi:MAG: shikimate dehydrogenase [Deltaproteobacteria bacterium]|nr:MAG: shikimate dehydrogenase [Deltaproteobacteria bacterium]